jgi:hypothetical protein
MKDGRWSRYVTGRLRSRYSRVIFTSIAGIRNSNNYELHPFSVLHHLRETSGRLQTINRPMCMHANVDRLEAGMVRTTEKRDKL